MTENGGKSWFKEQLLKLELRLTEHNDTLINNHLSKVEPKLESIEKTLHKNTADIAWLKWLVGIIVVAGVGALAQLLF